MIRASLLLCLALGGCVTNGSGLIGAGGHASGSYTVYEPGKDPRIVSIN